MFVCKVIIFCIVITNYCLAERSIFRPQDPLKPEIITRWINSKKEYRLKSYYLEGQALFNKFDKDFFMQHLLPKGDIPYRNKKDKKVAGAELQKLTEEALQEIYKGNKKFKNFKIFKDQDFNYITKSGLLILKFKDHPFVLKLFIETPETFVKPFSKGWQPGCFFIMGGGINRYLSGFTRIKNLEVISKRIDKSPDWSKQLDKIRKWYVLPQGCRWFELRSKNLGPQGVHYIQLPSVYGTISDFIKTKKQFNIFNREHRQFALRLCHFLGNRVDPHIDNFMKEKKTDKTLVVDTEHFPTMVGLRKPLQFSTYGSWYAQLTAKFIKDCFLRDKSMRRKLQVDPEEIMSC